MGKKNIIDYLFLLGNVIAVSIIVTGCSRDVSEYELSIVDGTNTYTGLYTGTLKSKKPTGEAKFVVKIDDNSNWVYNGAFSEGVFSGEGIVENYPCEIKLGDQTDAGTYSGAFNAGVISGTGTYKSALGWSYEGNFENGAIIGNGTVRAFPYKVAYEKTTLDGTYEGAVSDGVPNGNGKYDGKSNDISVNYEGEWKEGNFSGEGKIKSNSYTATLGGGVIRTGEYEGATLDGKASGEGIFKATTDSGINYSYSGEFANGTFEGIGTLEYESEEDKNYTGHFLNGDGAPTKSELLTYLGNGKSFVLFKPSEDTVKFIDEHENLFMAESLDAIKEFLDAEVSSNEFYKVPDKFDDILVKVKTKKITQIRQEEIYGNTVTWFVVNDTNNNLILGICYGELPNVNNHDSIVLYGLPVGIGSYQNGFGATTNAFVIYGAFVEK